MQAKLYTSLASFYHLIYPLIFDYEREFEFVRKHLPKRTIKSVLDLGCGSGHLARHLIEAGYVYHGIDVSSVMIRLAKSENLRGTFSRADMRKFRFRRIFDAAVMTGHTSGHLLESKGVLQTFESVRRALRPGGTFIFDFFDAEKIFPRPETPLVQRFEVVDTTLTRRSTFRPDLSTGFTWIWRATYTIESPGRPKKTVKDEVVLRAFTFDELRLLLKLAGFIHVRRLENDHLLARKPRK